jgi:hypothetical protein
MALVRQKNLFFLLFFLLFILIILKASEHVDRKSKSLLRILLESSIFNRDDYLFKLALVYI